MPIKTSPNLIQICNILSDLHVHDGSSIGDKLGITRAAVWKALKKLENLGVPITSAKAKGYAFTRPLYLLDQPWLQDQIGSSTNVEVYLTTDSTNNIVFSPNKKEGCLVQLAEQQTEGRGRLGRCWQSPFGHHIYLSLKQSVTTDISQLGGLCLASATAVCDAIETELALPSPLEIKWPNDIYYQGKKLAGILIEVQAQAHGNTYVTLGIGLNVNACSNMPSCSICLEEIVQKPLNRNPIALRLIQHLQRCIQQYDRENCEPFIEQWQTRDYLKDKTVTVQEGTRTISGVAKGIGPHGHLLIATEKSIQKVTSGDATLLPTK